MCYWDLFGFFEEYRGNLECGSAQPSLFCNFLRPLYDSRLFFIIQNCNLVKIFASIACKLAAFCGSVIPNFACKIYIIAKQ